MKASDFIVHLQQMIEEHGDLPLALMEYDEDQDEIWYCAIERIDGVYDLKDNERLLNEADSEQPERKVFLID